MTQTRECTREQNLTVPRMVPKKRKKEKKKKRKKEKKNEKKEKRKKRKKKKIIQIKITPLTIFHLHLPHNSKKTQKNDLILT